MTTPSVTELRYVCAACGQDFVEVTQAELVVRTAMFAVATGHAPKVADHSSHAHYRCATPSCALLMPPGWCFCLVPRTEIEG